MPRGRGQQRTPGLHEQRQGGWGRMGDVLPVAITICQRRVGRVPVASLKLGPQLVCCFQGCHTERRLLGSASKS